MSGTNFFSSRDSQTQREAIRDEQVRLAYAALPASLLTVLLNASVLAGLQWSVLPWDRLVFWYTAVVVVCAWRWGMHRSYRSSTTTAGRPANWRSRAIAGAFLSGLTWGSAAFLLFPLEHPSHQVLVILVLAGMAAGGISTLSSLMPASMLFLASILMPLALRLLTLGDETNLAVGLMGLVYLFMLALVSRRLNTTILESLTMRYERQQEKALAEHRAYHDRLTDLPNRRLLLDRLDRDISRSVRHGHVGSVIFLDLDDFKRINDSLGQPVGDELLRRIAERLTRFLRPEDTAARVGGDAFVIVLCELADTMETASKRAQQVAGKIRDALISGFVVRGQDLQVTASIGITLFPADGRDSEQILSHADTAMYRAKAQGRNSIRFFHRSMQEAAHKRLLMEKELRRALQLEQFELHYQPQVDHSGRLTGAEALVRWNHPTRGLVPAAEFIPVTEETGLILPLGEWVVKTACNHLQYLTHYGFDSSLCRIAIAVSPWQFRGPQFVDRMTAILQESGVDPQRLVLELTERIAADDVETTIDRVQRLKDLGFSLSIHDFGTGHSSLACLRRLPLDALKIDRSFVQDVMRDPGDADIIRTIVVMARNLGLDVIAEGVENEATFQFLRDCRCEAYQGLYFSRPLPFDRFTEYLRHHDLSTPRSEGLLPLALVTQAAPSRSCS